MESKSEKIPQKPEHIPEETEHIPILTSIEEKNLKNKLEEEGMQKVAELWKNGGMFNINQLKNIMKSGADEFKEKTGREMTYSEMRELYG
jgi:hypothetical protein